MFEHPLPLTIKPVKLARQEGKLSGFMPLQQLTTLAADCVSEEGRVEADLQLRMEQSRPEIHGTANAEVKLVCQRCLEPVAVKVDVSIALGFVQDYRLSNLQGYQPCLLSLPTSQVNLVA